MNKCLVCNQNFIPSKFHSKQKICLNKECKKKYHQQWHKNHKLKMRKYYKNKYKNNIFFKISGNLRRRLAKALKRNSKSLSTMKLINCNIEFLKQHLEKQFTEGMSWDNYGLWHIDHIRPCFSFDLSKPEEQAKCFHYTNLRPLWAIDNYKKGRKNNG